jgi:hypothetical protein
MADLKFGNTTPALGDIKVGSNDVSKIYQGSTEVWPGLSNIYYTTTICATGGSGREMPASKGVNAAGQEVDLTGILAIGTVVEQVLVTNTSIRNCVSISGYATGTTTSTRRIYTPTMNDFSDCTDCLPKRSYRALVCGTNQVVYVHGYYAFSNRQPIYIDPGEYQVDDVLLARTSSQSNGQCVQITAVGQTNVPTLFFDDDGGTYPVSLCNQCISD